MPDQGQSYTDNFAHKPTKIYYEVRDMGVREMGQTSEPEITASLCGPQCGLRILSDGWTNVSEKVFVAYQHDERRPGGVYAFPQSGWG